MKKQLTIELVPKTAWFSNVRSMVSKKDWDKLRKEAYKQADYKCEICDGTGNRHPVECHEIWKYDDKNYVQKLMGMIALCPSCHEVKHIGFANTQGRGEVAEQHIAKVNRWTKAKTDKYVKEQFIKWRERSSFDWTIDLTWLEERDIEYKNDRKT